MKLWPRLCFYSCLWFCTQGGVCYPSMHCRWYPSMPCSRSPGGACCWGGGWGVLLPGGVWSGGCLLGGVPAPRQGVSGLGGTCLGGCFLQGGTCSRGSACSGGVVFCYGLLLWPSGLVAFWLKVVFWYGLLVWSSLMAFRYGLPYPPNSPPPKKTATVADGTHPTGMYSC